MFLHHKYCIHYCEVMNYDDLPFNVRMVVLTDLNIRFSIHGDKIHFNDNFGYLSTCKRNMDIDELKIYLIIKSFIFINSLHLSIRIGFDDMVIENQFVL